MEYKVVKDFKDLKDNGHVYRAGDSFPRPSVNVDAKRIAELSTTKNARKEVLIEALVKESAHLVEEPVKKGKKRNVRADTQGD